MSVVLPIREDGNALKGQHRICYVDDMGPYFYVGQLYSECGAIGENELPWPNYLKD